MFATGGDNSNKRCLSTLNLSRPGNLDHPPEVLGYFLSMSRFFFCNVPELLRVSRKNFQVSRFPEKSPDSRRNNFSFVPRQRLLELSTPCLLGFPLLESSLLLKMRILWASRRVTQSLLLLRL